MTCSLRRSEAFQAELAALYAHSPLGQPPMAPAQLALALLLQAYTGVSDDDVSEATTMDRRWQLARDCLDGHEPPFSKGTLVGFRAPDWAEPGAEPGSAAHRAHD
jgi:hypothetical protein